MGRIAAALVVLLVQYANACASAKSGVGGQLDGSTSSRVLAQAPTRRAPIRTRRASLRVDQKRLAKSITFSREHFVADHCAFAEKALGNEVRPLPRNLSRGATRSLIRFDVSIKNVGNAAFRLGLPGDPRLYQWGSCHGHWHLKDFTKYELQDSARHRVVSGRKQAFCAEDTERFNPRAGAARFTCSNQGISPGWSDVYGKHLDGQWVDITGVPAGNYTLKISIDPANRFPQAHRRPIVARARVTIPRRT